MDSPPQPPLFFLEPLPPPPSSCSSRFLGNEPEDVVVPLSAAGAVLPPLAAVEDIAAAGAAVGAALIEPAAVEEEFVAVTAVTSSRAGPVSQGQMDSSTSREGKEERPRLGKKWKKERKKMRMNGERPNF